MLLHLQCRTTERNYSARDLALVELVMRPSCLHGPCSQSSSSNHRQLHHPVAPAICWPNHPHTVCLATASTSHSACSGAIAAKLCRFHPQTCSGLLPDCSPEHWARRLLHGAGLRSARPPELRVKVCTLTPGKEQSSRAPHELQVGVTSVCVCVYIYTYVYVYIILYMYTIL